MFFGATTAARRARRPGTGYGPGAGRPQARTIALIIAATAGTGLVVLGGLAWAAPTTISVTRPVQLQQRVAMTYDAQAERSAAYPTGGLRTGDPVFLRLVPTMDVQIVYRVGPGAASLGGTRRVTAELRSANGWHRGFELLPRERFTGGGFEAIASLDLTHVQALVAGLEKASGLDNGRYTLSVRNEVALAGSISGRAGISESVQVRDSFFPELTFRYDHVQLRLAGTSKVSASGSGKVDGSVIRSRVSSVEVPSTTAGHLDVLGQELPVRLLRTGGLAVAVVLFLSVGLGQRARRAARRKPPERMVRRIVLADTGMSRPRVPHPRTAGLADRQLARIRPGAHDLTRD
jgi:hypothetical protein